MSELTLRQQRESHGNWTYRRRFMYAVTLFCAIVIGYVLWTGADNGPADTAVTMSFVTIMAIVGSYVFGSTWGDVSSYKNLR